MQQKTALFRATHIWRKDLMLANSMKILKMWY
jgi:hypothetical protein